MQLPASALEQLISKPRLDSYKGYWKASPECAVGLYMWNGDVCSKVSKSKTQNTLLKKCPS